MAPTFKISFPLPGWRSNSSTQTTPGSQSSNRSENDGSPLAYPGSKAERVLGGAELDGNDQRKKPIRKERKSLRKYPSFMSVTLADEESESSKPEDGFPFPGMKMPGEYIHQNARILRRQGSSPLLGESYMAPSTSTDCYSNASSPHTRHAESSTTLRSYYDKSKSPNLISQQTSSSSARDLALRKGLPQISSPLGQSVSGDPTPAQTSITHGRNRSAESKVSEGSKASASSKIARTPRRRPSVNDPPTLYPDVPRAFHAVSPPPALINSSLPTPMRPTDLGSKSFSRPRWWYRGKTDRPISPTPVNSDGPCQAETSDQRLSSIKVNVRRPKAGVRNWFDGFDEEELEREAEEETSRPQQESRYQLPEKSAQPAAISEVLSQDPRMQPLKQRKSSFSSKSGPSDRKLSFKLDSPPPRRVPSGFSPVLNMRSSSTFPRSPGSRTIHPSEINRGIPVGVDLQIESVLSLSSSEDEDESKIVPSQESFYRGHHIRASVDKADYGDDLLVGSAQRVQKVRPRPVVNKHYREVPTSRRSTSPESVPPVPQIPSRPQLGQRNSSLRWRDVMEERSTTTTDAGGDSTVENSSTNADTPLTTPTSARTSTITPHKKKSSFRGSKLMKVTSEEEKLLEAMREKRASIRANDFQKGFNKALALQAGNELCTQRPQTAGADGRQSFTQRSSYTSNNSTSIKGPGSARGSVCPTPPLLTSARYNSNPHHTPKASLASLGAGSRRSLSTDNLLLQDQEEEALDNDSYSFPPVPDIVRSDVMPSTPSTGNLPLTPPPLMPGHGMVVGGFGRSPRRGSGSESRKGEMRTAGRNGHERKRTVSSGVVMLDGVEAVAREADEEREIVGWAFESY